MVAGIKITAAISVCIKEFTITFIKFHPISFRTRSDNHLFAAAIFFSKEIASRISILTDGKLIETKQALAAIGRPRLTRIYYEFLAFEPRLKLIPLS